MKKRLLSAALALAMVLTMLPLTVFAANGDNGDTVTYYAKNKVATDEDGRLNDHAGWFYDSGLKVMKDGKPTSTKVYHEKRNGVITSTGTSGKWYDTIERALTVGKASTLKLLGDGYTVDLADATGSSLTIDLNGNSLTVSGNLVQNLTAAEQAESGRENTKLNTLKIQNSAPKDGTSWPSVGGSITAESQAFTYDAAKTSGYLSITLENKKSTSRTLKVTLTDAEMGGITTDKATANISLTNGIVSGNLDLNGTGTTVTLNGSESRITGNVLLYASKGFELKSGKAPTVTVNGGKILGEVKSDDAEGLVNAKYGVTVNGASNAQIGSIKLPNAEIKVNGGTTGDIEIGIGKLEITNNATVGDVTWGGLGKKGTLDLTVSGENSIVASVQPAGGTSVTLGKVAISGGVFGPVNLGNYADNGITGGAFSESLIGKTERVANWLGKSNQYLEIKSAPKDSGTTYYYYVGSNFQDLVDRWAKIVADDRDPSAKRVNCTGIGNKITFLMEYDGKDDQVVLATVEGNSNDAMLAPSLVNKVSVSNWHVVGAGAGKDKVYAAGMAVPFKEDVILCVTLPGGDGSDIISVTADGGISAKLDGSVIRLSGYAPAYETDGFPISLTITTVKETYKNAVTVNWWYNLNMFGLSNAKMPFSAEVSNTLTYNGKIYTFDISGLKLMASSNIDYTIGADTEELKLVGEDSLNAGKIKSVKVTFNAGEKASQATFAETMSRGLDPIDFSKSPAVMEALNVAAGKLTTLKTYVDKAKRAAAKEDGINNPTNDQLAVYAYDKVVIQPFLNVTVSGTYTPGGRNSVGSMTANIVPYYYIIVIKSNDPTDKPYIDNPNGTTLGTLSGDYGEVKVTLGLPDNFAATGKDIWLHHNSKYVYKGINNNGESVTFTTLHGFSPFIINGEASAVEVDKIQGMPSGKGIAYYYDSLQEAVDVVAEGGTITLHNDYKKETTVSVTGVARNFTVDPGANGNLTLTFTGGADVSATKATNNVYNVTLSASSTYVTSASIVLGSYTNGTVSLSADYAKQGSTVTITATGYSGYTPLTPTVTADNGASVVVSGSNGRYSFVVPNGARTITVRPSFVYSSGSNWNGGGNSGNNGNTSNNGNNGNTGYNLPFTDVIAGAWYTDAVAYCYNTYAGGSRLMQGVNTAGDRFGVNSPMTRAELVEVMWRIAGSPVETPRTYFTDVRSSDWYYNSMSWAANHGYVTGYGDGTALPNRSISRQELAAILYRFGAGGTLSSSMRNFNLANRYPDGQGVASWAQDAMKWAAFTGILSGQGRATMNRLDAYATAYRSELAVTIRNFYQYYYEV